ncbi:unnamed protein product, partial [Brassica oleracea var. botrytis]
TAKKRSRPSRILELQNRTIVNTDAAWRATNRTAGLGWIINNLEGSPGYTLVAYHFGSALVAEGLALKSALSCCKERGIKRLHCFSDSAQLIKTVNNGESYPELYGIVLDVFAISSSFDELSFFGYQERETKGLII